MNYVIEGQGALVNEAGEETPLKAGDFALVNPFLDKWWSFPN